MFRKRNLVTALLTKGGRGGRGVRAMEDSKAVATGHGAAVAALLPTPDNPDLLQRLALPYADR